MDLSKLTAHKMRRNIVHIGADNLSYEIRSIVAIGRKMVEMGMSMDWENIGDPIHKGEKPVDWIVDIAHQTLDDALSWGYSDTQGILETRQVLVDFINQRKGGVKVTTDDILFFNGLGDAISTIFGLLRREARILGPSPAYSTLSSAEAAHSGYEHLTYALDPDRGWIPDIEDIRMKVRYNDTIAGILLINPNNPTGAVYPREVLEEIVSIAREYDLMVICDEIYSHIVYNEAQTVHLSEVLGDVPGLALRGISKEFPWPGSRCGWIEILNRGKDSIFDRWVQSLIDAKMLEVCSTSLPQQVLSKVYTDPRYINHLKARQEMYAQRAIEACQILEGTPGIKYNQPQGAFYFTIVFDDGALNQLEKLTPKDPKIKAYLESILKPEQSLDQQFCYRLMAAKGICTVPLSSFCCPKQGFRATLLEEDDHKRQSIFRRFKEAMLEIHN